MENIILSLLLIKSMTIYEMRMFIQECLTTVCSDSLGSIQAGIKKLISENCVEYREYLENGINKKKYSITDVGLIQFKEWIQMPMNLQKIKNMEEGKFFFLGMVPIEIRDTLTVHGKAGFEIEFGGNKVPSMSSIGDMYLCPVGTEVAVGYDGGVIKGKEEVDPSDPLSGLKIVWMGSSVTFGMQSGGYTMADEIHPLREGYVS